MHKIFIFGPGLSGKSTLAKRLQNIYQIKNYELDELLYGVHELSEREDLISKIFGRHKNGFIAEGIYTQDRQDLILEQCTKIIILRVPSRKRKIRIIRRTFKRAIGLEKSSNISNFFTIVALWKFDNKYVRENREKKFLERIERLGKKDIVEFIKN